MPAKKGPPAADAPEAEVTFAAEEDAAEEAPAPAQFGELRTWAARDASVRHERAGAAGSGELATFRVAAAGREADGEYGEEFGEDDAPPPPQDTGGAVWSRGCMLAQGTGIRIEWVGGGGMAAGTPGGEPALSGGVSVRAGVCGPNFSGTADGQDCRFLEWTESSGEEGPDLMLRLANTRTPPAEETEDEFDPISTIGRPATSTDGQLPAEPTGWASAQTAHVRVAELRIPPDKWELNVTFPKWDGHSESGTVSSTDLNDLIGEECVSWFIELRGGAEVRVTALEGEARASAAELFTAQLAELPPVSGAELQALRGFVSNGEQATLGDKAEAEPGAEPGRTGRQRFMLHLRWDELVGQEREGDALAPLAAALAVPAAELRVARVRRDCGELFVDAAADADAVGAKLPAAGSLHAAVCAAVRGAARKGGGCAGSHLLACYPAALSDYAARFAGWWEAKAAAQQSRNPVLEELLDNMSCPADTPPAAKLRKLALLAEQCLAEFGPLYPHLNGLELLLAWLYSQEGVDTDRAMGWDDVPAPMKELRQLADERLLRDPADPSRLLARADIIPRVWRPYKARVGESRNPDIYRAANRAPRVLFDRFVSGEAPGDDDADVALARKWVRFVAALSSIASRQPPEAALRNLLGKAKGGRDAAGADDALLTRAQFDAWRREQKVWRAISGLPGGALDAQRAKAVELPTYLLSTALIPSVGFLANEQRRDPAGEFHTRASFAGGGGAAAEAWDAAAERKGSVMLEVEGARYGLPMMGLSAYPREMELLLPPLAVFGVGGCGERAWGDGAARKEALQLDLQFHAWLGDGELREVLRDARRDLAESDAVLRGVLEAERAREEAGEGTLTKEMIASGLGALGRTHDGRSLAYLRCDLAGLGLRGIRAIAGFGHLQELDVSNNQVDDVSAVATLRGLCTLRAPRNRLRTVLDGVPPTSALQEVDVSHNEVAAMPDLTPHRFLRVLRLDHNKIEGIRGVGGLQYLVDLSLDGNMLDTIRGLEGCPALRRLSLRNNAINDAAGVEAVRGTLEELLLSGNELIHLRPFGDLSRLRVLDVAANRLADFDDLRRLRPLVYLRSLGVEGNPLQSPEDGGADGADSDACSDVVQEDDDDAQKADDSQQFDLPPGISVAADAAAAPGPAATARLADAAGVDPSLGPRLVPCASLLPAAQLFRFRVLTLLPQLTSLDGVDAPPQEKVKARNVVCGDDDEARVRNEVQAFGKSVTVVGDAALKEGRA